MSLLLPTMLFNASAQAAGTDITGQWRHCSAQYNALLSDDAYGEETIITSDSANSTTSNEYQLDGRVLISGQQQQLSADHVIYNKLLGTSRASGNITYNKEQVSLQGSTANIQHKTKLGSIEGVSFQLQQRHGNGTASIARLEEADITVLENVSFTTCDPGKTDWLLTSPNIKLDHKQGVGTAKHAVLRFAKVPFLYLPYISFPISDQRKSGFLTPNIVNRSTTGNEIWLPYYLNLAPNIDATITPRSMSDRGTMLINNFRYLTRNSKGSVDIEYLASDQIYGDDRNYAVFKNNSRLAPTLQATLDLNYVSDSQYFSDFSSNLNTASIAHIKQTAGLNYQGRNWKWNTRVEAYQTVDTSIASASRPYQRLPQIRLSKLTPITNKALKHSFNSEYVYFKRNERLSAQRLNLQPSLSLPYDSLSGYIRPTLQLQYTGYLIDNPAVGDEALLNRTLPIFSLDSGVFFERDLNFGKTSLLQTLEPRLFYLYVPYQDQTELPIYDSGLPDFSYDRLFATNRFNGIDRIGDANQITLAVTSSFLEKSSGRQLLSASIGRIYYLKNRKVALSGTAIDTDTDSEILATLRGNFTNNLSLTSDLRWDDEQNQLDKSNLLLSYNNRQRSIFNVSRRFRRNSLNQTDVSLLWPISQKISLLGRWNYSHLDKKPLETLSGLEYQNCCWAVRLISRRYINTASTGSEYQSAIAIQLELKGLANIGDNIENILESGILGYQN